MWERKSGNYAVLLYDARKNKGEEGTFMRKKKSGKVPMSADAARKEGREQGLSMAMAIMFMALLDGGYLQPEDMAGAWEKVEYLSDSIAKGYVNAADIRKTLNEEYGVKI